MEKITNFNDTVFSEDVNPTNEKIVFPSSIKMKKEGTSTKVKKTAKKSTAMVTANNKAYEDFTFDFMGDTYEVNFHDGVYDMNDNEHWIFGNCCLAERVINISTKSQYGKPLSKNQIKTTFTHELTHIILESGQFFEESYNEHLVEWIGKCISMLFLTDTRFNKIFD